MYLTQNLLLKCSFVLPSKQLGLFADVRAVKIVANKQLNLNRLSRWVDECQVCTFHISDLNLTEVKITVNHYAWLLQ